MVTPEAETPQSSSMRNVACTLALLSILYVAAVVGRLEGRIWPLTDGVHGHQEQRTTKVSTITYSKTVNSTTYTRTYTRNEGESETDFDARAKALWTKFCETNGI